MGALEALNGWLLFGLTTAFLFSIMEKVWSLRRGGEEPGIDQTRVPANRDIPVEKKWRAGRDSAQQDHLTVKNSGVH